MDNNFLGVGWPSPLTFTDDGQVNMTRYEAAVQQSIWMILSTAPGERLMRPEFGCGIHDLVFATSNAGTLGQVINTVRRSLTEWEARIDVLAVTARPDDGKPNCLLIEINYRVRTTNNRFNLVYPFYVS